MAILASLFAMLGRFAGRVVNALLGWATILLFGRVDPRTQTVVGFIALGSLVWVAAIAGTIVPDMGTFLIAAVPRLGWIGDDVVRWGMLAVVVLLPLAVGIVGAWLTPADRRPKGMALVGAVLRGYPFTALLAVTLVFLAGVALVRRLRALARRWEDTHLPVVVKPDGYDHVVAALRGALSDAGLDTAMRPAPRAVSTPPRLLDRIAGKSLGSMVPDRLVLLTHPDLEILVYPSDLAMSGQREVVARARAGAAIGLIGAPAWLTVSADAQRIEDQLVRLARGARVGEPSTDLARVDERLASAVIPFDEWETLMRIRLAIGQRALEPPRPADELRSTDTAARAAMSATGRGRGRLIELASAVAVVGLLAIDVLLLLTGRRPAAPRHDGWHDAPDRAERVVDRIRTLLDF
jgi:hypothetical protein